MGHFLDWVFMKRPDRWLALQSLWALLLARLQGRKTAYPDNLQRLGEPVDMPRETEGASSDDRETALRIRATFTSVANRAPFYSDCMVRAIATRRLLQRRGVAATTVLGIQMDKGEIKAHVWVLAAGVVVTGKKAMAGHTPMAAYR